MESRGLQRRRGAVMKSGWLNRLFGNRGERAAARFLRQAGFRILQRNARSQFGEIDLICREGETLVFVEVKTRTSQHFGHPAEAVDRRKQRQLTRAALAWLKRRGWTECACRFDVIAITWEPGQSPVIEHFRNAFEAC